MATQEQARGALEATQEQVLGEASLEATLGALGQMSNWRVATVLLSMYTRAIMIVAIIISPGPRYSMCVATMRIRVHVRS